MSWMNKWSGEDGRAGSGQEKSPFVTRTPAHGRIVGSGSNVKHVRVPLEPVAGQARHLSLYVPKKTTLVALVGILLLLVGVAALVTMTSYDPVRVMEHMQMQEGALEEDIAADTDRIHAVQSQLRALRDNPGSLSSVSKQGIAAATASLKMDEASIRANLARLRKSKQSVNSKLQRVTADVMVAKQAGGSREECTTGQCYTVGSFFVTNDCLVPGPQGLNMISSAEECQRECQTNRCCKFFTYSTVEERCFMKQRIGAPDDIIQSPGLVYGPKCCELKIGEFDPNADGMCHSPVVDPKTGLPDKYNPCYTHDMNLIASQCGATTIASTAVDCQARCQQSECCLWFTFNTIGGKCSLKANAGNLAPVKLKGTTIGPKCCQQGDAPA